MSARLESPEEATARLAAEPLTAPERAALWQRVEAGVEVSRRKRRTRVALAFGTPALAIAALLIVVFFVPVENNYTVVDRAAPSRACALDPRAAQLRLGERCPSRSLTVAGDDWELAPGTDVVRTRTGAHVLAGRVRFHVRPRTAPAQFRVRVSDGEVHVIGTVFQIEQHAAQGSLVVTQGVVEFVWNDGTRERVAAGQTLHWPRSAPEAPAPAPAGTATDAGTRARAKPGPVGTPAPDMDRVLERLLQLRSQKRFGEAVELLRTTLAQRGLSQLQSERISYELGLALEASGSPDCAHWHKHVARFGTQRHAAAIAARLQRCDPQ